MNDTMEIVILDGFAADVKAFCMQPPPQEPTFEDGQQDSIDFGIYFAKPVTESFSFDVFYRVSLFFFFFFFKKKINRENDARLIFMW
jgi:hypothetical protein